MNYIFDNGNHILDKKYITIPLYCIEFALLCTNFGTTHIIAGYLKSKPLLITTGIRPP